MWTLRHHHRSRHRESSGRSRCRRRQGSRHQSTVAAVEQARVQAERRGGCRNRSNRGRGRKTQTRSQRRRLSTATAPKRAGHTACAALRRRSGGDQVDGRGGVSIFIRSTRTVALAVAGERAARGSSTAARGWRRGRWLRRRRRAWWHGRRGRRRRWRRRRRWHAERQSGIGAATSSQLGHMRQDPATVEADGGVDTDVCWLGTRVPAAERVVWWRGTGRGHGEGRAGQSTLRLRRWLQREGQARRHRHKHGDTGTSTATQARRHRHGDTGTVRHQSTANGGALTPKTPPQLAQSSAHRHGHSSAAERQREGRQSRPGTSRVLRHLGSPHRACR